MKRSEMVDFMAKTWREYCKQLTPENAGVRNGCDNLLSKLEEAGMLPPTVKNPELPKEMNVWDHATEAAIDELYNRRPGIVKFAVNEWEPEDEA